MHWVEEQTYPIFLHSYTSHTWQLFFSDSKKCLCPITKKWQAGDVTDDLFLSAPTLHWNCTKCGTALTKEIYDTVCAVHPFVRLYKTDVSHIGLKLNLDLLYRENFPYSLIAMLKPIETND